jgi:hypothetical protein
MAFRVASSNTDVGPGSSVKPARLGGLDGPLVTGAGGPGKTGSAETNQPLAQQRWLSRCVCRVLYHPLLGQMQVHFEFQMKEFPICAQSVFDLKLLILYDPQHLCFISLPPRSGSAVGLKSRQRERIGRPHKPRPGILAWLCNDLSEGLSGPRRAPIE